MSQKGTVGWPGWGVTGGKAPETGCSLHMRQEPERGGPNSGSRATVTECLPCLPNHSLKSTLSQEGHSDKHNRAFTSHLHIGSGRSEHIPLTPSPVGKGKCRGQGQE